MLLLSTHNRRRSDAAGGDGGAMLLAVMALLLVGGGAQAQATDSSLYPNAVQVLNFNVPSDALALNGSRVPDLLLTVTVADGQDVSIRCQPRSTDADDYFPWASSLPSGATERLRIPGNHPAFAPYPGDAGNVLCRLQNEGQPPRAADASVQAEWLLDGTPQAIAEEEAALEQILVDCCGGDGAEEGAGGACMPWRSVVVNPGDDSSAVGYCGLQGMVCDSDGHFVQLDFDGYNLTCELPSAQLAKFPKLRTLGLAQGHDLKGNLEKVLYDISSGSGALETLLLANSPGLSGKLTSDDEAGPLCALVKNGLRVLDMRNVSAEGSIPPCLVEDGSRLQFLHLGYNALTGEIPDVFADTVPLAWFTVNGNQLSGGIPESLGNLRQLYMLNTTSNRLTGPLPESLGRCEYLMHVLARNNGITGGIPAAIGTHPRLITIDLRNNRLEGPLPDAWYNSTDAGMDALRALNLQAIRLANNSLGGPIPRGLAVLTDLLDLNLAVNAFTGELPHDISGPDGRTTFPNMLTFNLSRNALNGSIPEAYGDDMRMFIQVDNMVEGRNGALTSWTFVFDLSGNDLSGPLPEFLDSDSLQPGQAAWMNVNLTNAGDFDNACEERYSWVNGTACTGPSGYVAGDDNDSDYGVERSPEDDDDDDDEQQAVAAAASEEEEEDDDSSDDGLSAGAVVGIVVGVLAGTALLALAALLVAKRARGGGSGGATTSGPGLPVWGSKAASKGKFEKFDDAAAAAAGAGSSSNGAKATGIDTVVPAA